MRESNLAYKCFEDYSWDLEKWSDLLEESAKNFIMAEN